MCVCLSEKEEGLWSLSEESIYLSMSCFLIASNRGHLLVFTVTFFVLFRVEYVTVSGRHREGYFSTSDNGPGLLCWHTHSRGWQEKGIICSFNKSRGPWTVQL